MYDVAIIGAGVTGGLLARTLSKYNLKICILEKENDVALGATKANSAIVHAGFDAEENSLKAKLNVKGSKMMKQVCQELGVRYKNNGALVLGFNDEDRKALEVLLKRGIANGVEGLEIIEKAELKQKEPNVSDNAICALYAPTSAIICPYDLAISAIGNAMDNGAELKLEFEVLAIERLKSGYKISSQNDSITACFVVNCAGAYADKIASLFGDNSFSITARKGEYILLDKPCGNLVSHTLFRTPSKMGKGILVSPTVDNNLILGPTSVNIEEKDNKSTTSDGLLSVIEKAKENLNAVPLQKTIRSFCGLRAVGSTGDFIINSPCDNFINVAGIESPGLSASPAIAEYVVNLLKDLCLELKENKNFCPYRRSFHAFFDASTEEKNKIIKENAAFGKIVCRCEGITEGEIIDAIKRNPRATDLDGVKRRTRAQMGRCQGGFCGPQIIEIIARETYVPFESVTKFGKGSLITFERTKGGNL